MTDAHSKAPTTPELEIDKILSQFAAECVFYTYEANDLPKHDQDTKRIKATEARTQLLSLLTNVEVEARVDELNGIRDESGITYRTIRQTIADRLTQLKSQLKEDM
jgi:hypothetical protein